MKHILLTTATILLATVSLMAQDLIVPKKGNPTTVYNVDAGGTFIYYTLEQDANSALSRIAKDSVLMIRRADGSVMDFTATQPIAFAPATPATVEKPKVDYPVIDEADIHGYYFAKGNKVFIPVDSPFDYERAGQQKTKDLVEEWGYWTVVDRPEQAHFILQYTTQTEGSDMSWLLIRPREYYRISPSVSRNSFTNLWRQKIGLTAMFCYSSEEVEDNQKAASKLFNGLKMALTVPSSSEAKRFLKHHSKFMDADKPEKDHSEIGVNCSH